MQYIHFIITRLNIQFKGAEVVSEAWTRHRWELFETYTLPSMLAQRNTQFHWLLYINPNTPSDIVERLNHTASRCGFLRVIPIANDEAMKAHWRTTITKECEEYDTLITSRVDSDDALALTYVEQVQGMQTAAKPRLLINFNNGLTLAHSKPAYAFQCHMPANPFVSLIEPANKNFQSVVGPEHHQWKTHQNYTAINTTKPMWLQVIHGKNLWNQLEGSPIKYNNFPKSFGIPNPNYPSFYWLKSQFQKLRKRWK